VEGGEIGVKAADHHRGQLRRPAELVPDGQNEVGHGRCAEQALDDRQCGPQVRMKDRIQHPDQKRQARRHVLIKKTEFRIVQSAELLGVKQRQRKLEIDDRIDPEFGASDGDRIGMGGNCGQ
jgi:hypothetical protein